MYTHSSWKVFTALHPLRLEHTVVLNTEVTVLLMR